ncbi:hypothetical protein F4X86_00025 [Candidatus Saccharibacteria bacterium]|nr:hypothetical protein [Candidatus Saccharibacteria bacterium]
MTCITGIIAKNDVYMGVDSASGMTDGQFQQTVSTKKLIFKRGMMIGYTSAWRMGNILEHEFEPPARRKGMDLEKYMVVDFIGALRKSFKDAGFTEIEHSKEHAGDFLVAIEQGSRLFEIRSDFSVITPVSYAAVGSGMFSALASLKTTEGLKLGAAERIRLALETAANFNFGVRGPFEIASFKDRQDS